MKTAIIEIIDASGSPEAIARELITIAERVLLGETKGFKWKIEDKQE